MKSVIRIFVLTVVLSLVLIGCKGTASTTDDLTLGDATPAPAFGAQPQNTPVADVPNTVPTVAAPVQEVAPAVESAELPSICDADLIGPSLTNSASKELVVPVPAGGNYKYFLASMDSAVISYAGENTDTVKGALVFSDTGFTIVTVTGAANGLGWNAENERFNVHVCAFPVTTDVVATLRDWQFGNDNGNAGEHKPVGVMIADGALNFIWNSSSFTLSDFDAAFK